MKFYDIVITEDGMSIIDDVNIIQTFPFVKGSFIDICNNNINFWSKDLFKTKEQHHTWINYNNKTKEALYYNLDFLKNTNIMHELHQGTNKPRYYSPNFDYSTTNTNYLTIVNTSVQVNNVEYMTSIIKEFCKNGELIFEWSVLDHLDILNLSLEKMIIQRDEQGLVTNQTSFIACNGVCKIPKNNLHDERFKEGNYLVSERTLGMIFIVDKDTKEVVWKIAGSDLNYHSSHYAHMIPAGLKGEGNILFYNNGTMTSPTSSIIEFNPITFEIVFEYESEEIKSAFRGSVQKTVKGTYIVCAAEQGRLIEIDKNKNIIRDLKLSKPEFYGTDPNKYHNYNLIHRNLLSFYRMEQIPADWIQELINNYSSFEKAINQLEV